MKKNVKSVSGTEFFSNNTRSTTVIPFTNQSTTPITKIINFGMWAPYQLPLESIKNTTEQKNAINAILKQGYNEYYFAMGDFTSKAARSMTENLLQSADGTKLRIIIILLPPSEAGSKGNFDWNGWIEYLNPLKAKYPTSLDGFVIDDFNLAKDSAHANKGKGNNDTSNNGNNHAKDSNNENNKTPKENVNFMLKSKLDEALEKKRKDLHFYPVLYFEGFKTNDVKRNYYNYADGIVLASSNYYNVTELSHNLKVFSKVFDDKPIKYVVYTAKTSNYIDNSPPSDRVILSTLAIANKSGVVKDIIIWRNTNSPVIRDYLSNMNNTKYMSFVSMMEKLQIKDENTSNAYNNAYGLYNPQSISDLQQEQDQQQNLKNSGNNHHNNEHNNKNENGKNTDHNKSSSLSSPQQSSPSIPLTPRLGIGTFDLTPSIAEDMMLPRKYKGAVVQSVIPGSPAYKAGFKGSILDVDKSGYLIRRGDVIIAVDGHKVDGAMDIIKQLKKKHPGDLLNLIVNRNNQISNMMTKL
ncbi:MAG: PDZ domain-containing protein [Nitrososphaeraceae archaeon]